VLWVFGCLLVRHQDKLRRPLALPKFMWPLALLFVVVVLQTIAGTIVFSGDAWVLVFYLATCAFALSSGYVFGCERINDVPLQASFQSLSLRFAMLLVLGGLCSIVVALGQVLDVWDNVMWVVHMPVLRRPGGNLGQPNQLATLILFSIASIVYLFESRWLRTFTALPVAAVLLFGLALTESRSGALGLSLMAAWWFLKRRRIGFALSSRAVGLWLVYFACCFWFWPTFFNFIQEGGWSDAVAVQVNTSAGTRLVVWPQLWVAVLQRPWFGWGLGEVSTAHNAVLHAYMESEPFTYAHNIVLDMAVGMGLPLTFLLVGAVVAWLWRRVRAANDLVSWYCLAIALPFGVHSMLEFPFAYAYLLFPVMFLLGVLEARLAPKSVVRIPWWSATVSWVLVSIAMAWSVVEYISIEEDFRVARFEFMRIGHTSGDYERPQIYMLTQLEALLEAARIEPAPKMALDQVELVRKVAMRYPWPATQKRYALSLALNDNPEEAIRQLKVMRAMHGEKAYEGIKANWKDLAENKYPQLGALLLP